MSFEDLADAFRQARREDMVAVTYEVAQNPAKPPQKCEKCDEPDFRESIIDSKETHLCKLRLQSQSIAEIVVTLIA